MNYFDDIQFINFIDRDTCARYDNHIFNGYYGLQFIEKGSIEVSVNRNPLEKANGPVVFFTFPGASFSYGSPPGKIRHQMSVCFSGKRVDSYLSHGLLSLHTENVFYRIQSSDILKQKIQELQKSLKNPGSYYKSHAVLLLEETLLWIVSQKEAVKKIRSVYLEDFQKLCNEITANPAKKWDFAMEARRMSLSESHFRRTFREITQMAPRQFLVECRLRLAQQLLLSGYDRISEVCKKTGFSDDFHFSRIFRKRIGLSPAKFRKTYS